MDKISDDECVKQLRKKCKEITISARRSTRGPAVQPTIRDNRSASGYAVRSSVGTVLESPSSEIRAEELSKPPSSGGRRSINGDEEHEKALVNRVYIKSSKYNVGWVLDSEADKCMSCHISFGIFTRKHHCRQCGDIICHNCSKQKLQLSTLDESGGSRICIKCMEVMYQDALMRRQKMNRKVYFSNVSSGSMLENSKQVQAANATARRSSGESSDEMMKARRKSKVKETKYRMFSPEKEMPNISDLFSMDEVYDAPPVEILVDNPQPPQQLSTQARTRDDMIKAALLHGVWEGSENGESTNPNSPTLPTTTENTPGSTENTGVSNQQQKQHSTSGRTESNDKDKEHSQLYESTFETPTKILQRRTQARVTHALTNGIWEAEEDGSISVASSDSPLSSSSSIKKAGLSGQKENYPKSNTSTPNSLSAGPYVLQEGYLERRVSADNVWSKEKYKLLSSGMLLCESNIKFNQINMKYATARGSRRNDESNKQIADSKRQYIIEIVHGDENIILACATADEQVGWVASLMAFNARKENVLSAKKSGSVNVLNQVAVTKIMNGQQLVEKAILSAM